MLVCTANQNLWTTLLVGESNWVKCDVAQGVEYTRAEYIETNFDRGRKR
jgi:hypothetical protein